MKVENQVCTLEQAEKLNMFGVKQIGHFSYKYTEPMATDVKYGYAGNGFKLFPTDYFNKKDATYYSAFTVAELGVMLPVTLGAANLDIIQIDVECYKYEKSFGIQLSDYVGAAQRTLHIVDCNTEAEARAAMLIHLLENNLIKVEEVNQRLTA